VVVGAGGVGVEEVAEVVEEAAAEVARVAAAASRESPRTRSGARAASGCA
jgi:hypothetical protein